MSRVAYVNGTYRRLPDAAVHIEDRGFQFSDGVYEVCEVREGLLIDEDLHLARLQRSLGELRIATPVAMTSLGIILREVVGQNRITDGLLYLQVTRGVAPRGHAFPVPEVEPTLVVTARRAVQGRRGPEAGIAVITVPETRWARVDIKTVSLLPNVLAKQAAFEAGAQEAWFVGADGFVTEGSSSNAWIVTSIGAVVTAPTSTAILKGVTRGVVLELIRQQGLSFEERPFSVAEAKSAEEAFITSATSQVMPVVQIDGQAIGVGRPGPMAARLREVLLNRVDSHSVA